MPGALETRGEGTAGARSLPAPGGRRSLADSPSSALFHALSFCVELFKREIHGSFMLMCRTKATARRRGPGRCLEAGAGRRGGSGLRVALACPGARHGRPSFLQTQSLSGSGRRARRTGSWAPPAPDGGLCAWNARSGPAVARGPGGPLPIRQRRPQPARDGAGGADHSLSRLPSVSKRAARRGVRLRTLPSSPLRSLGAA